MKIEFAEIQRILAGVHNAMAVWTIFSFFGPVGPSLNVIELSEMFHRPIYVELVNKKGKASSVIEITEVKNIWYKVFRPKA